MNKNLIDRVARALHTAMLHSPVFGKFAVTSWDNMPPGYQSECRAVTHSALVAAGPREVWVVTDESDRSEDEHKMSSVIVVASTRDAALAHLATHYGGADELVWASHDMNEWWFTTNYGEYPWVMQKQTIEPRGDA